MRRYKDNKQAFVTVRFCQFTFLRRHSRILSAIKEIMRLLAEDFDCFSLWIKKFSAISNHFQQPFIIS